MPAFDRVRPAARPANNPAPVVSTPARPARVPADGPAPLWLALAFPHFALDVTLRGAPSGGEALLTEVRGGMPVVHDCTDGPAALGVHPGMRLAAALALVDSAQVFARDPLREARALQALAVWALAFSPQLSTDGDAALVIEIGRSLRLFGGLEAVRTRVAAGLGELGFRARLGIAPTPIAARWLARAGRATPCTEPAELSDVLAGLPVQAADFSARERELLQGLGIRSIGEVLRLPRDGLARRLGPAWVRRLDQALGRQPDPRRAITPPKRFQSRLELPFEITAAPMLLHAGRRLLAELEGFLRGCARVAQRLDWRIHHREGPASRLRVGLREPTRDSARMATLLEAHLHGLSLPAPVVALTREVSQTRTAGEDPTDLFGTAALEPQALVERLRARLGHDAVIGLALDDDHRPERAWRCVEPELNRVDAATDTPRPLWLVDPPEPLRARDDRPHAQGGALRLLSGPERIETGWWEAAAVRRDYYIAADRAGHRLWVYRTPSGEWWLHGRFD